MPAPYHCICSKLDRALVLYLVSRAAGTVADTFPARRSSDLTLPCTVCWTDRATPIRNTGSYTCRVSIIVKCRGLLESGEEAGAVQLAADARIATAFDAFYTIEDDSDWDSKKLAAQITTAARAGAAEDATTYGDLVDFTCLDVRHGDQETTFEEDTDTWVETFSLEIDAAPFNVS